MARKVGDPEEDPVDVVQRDGEGRAGGDDLREPPGGGVGDVPGGPREVGRRAGEVERPQDRLEGRRGVPRSRIGRTAQVGGPLADRSAIESRSGPPPSRRSPQARAVPVVGPGTPVSRCVTRPSDHSRNTCGMR